MGRQTGSPEVLQLTHYLEAAILMYSILHHTVRCFLDEERHGIRRRACLALLGTKVLQSACQPNSLAPR